MSLSDLRRGQTATLHPIGNETTRLQLLRLGITAGTRIRCHARLPFGPVVLAYQGQEIAIGRIAARQIQVAVDSATEHPIKRGVS